MVNVDELRQLLECIPQDTVGYAFAYGSGAVSQLGEKSDVKMVDFIIVSNNSLKFHEENLQRNPCHYSALRYFGANTLTKLQRNFAARVFYNTHISYKGRLLKYGVVEYEDLERDLLDWRWLYLAGRLHKVVVDIVPPPKTLAAAIHENRISAAQIALLLLPGTFTLEQFLTMVVSLSYNGDFRMLFGEDKNKIKKIVDGSSQKLAEIFMPILENDTRLTITRTSRIDQDTNMAAVYHRIQLLPCAILERLQKVWNQRDSKQRDIEEVTFSLARRLDVAHHIDDAISSIVAPSAIRQTVDQQFMNYRRWKKAWLVVLSTMASDRADWKRLIFASLSNGVSLSSDGNKSNFLPFQFDGINFLVGNVRCTAGLHLMGRITSFRFSKWTNLLVRSALFLLSNPLSFC